MHVHVRVHAAETPLLLSKHSLVNQVAFHDALYAIRGAVCSEVTATFQWVKVGVIELLVHGKLAVNTET